MVHLGRPLKKAINEQESESERKYALGNILEIKIAIIAKKKSSESDKKLGEWRMDIHEVLSFNVPRCELAEMDLIEPAAVVMDQDIPRPVSNGQPRFRNITHTTLSGRAIRKRRTPAATRMTMKSSLHSALVRSIPPGG